ncbi:MAG: cysteinyl-tRNA synthetase, partial [Candidatus Saccharibacteria bacterium]|nr:cysteinyl-tRNA synthetase [Candidatus Saccharibacteria bacterium]
AFMRERGGDPDRAGKRNPLDFLLWKGVSDPHDPAKWNTVVGNGRPGWHIECTVMSEKTLGIPFDLHGGGTDLIFPHHECEIAQSYGLNGHHPARHWIHVSPLLYAGEKMSKSLGNLIFAKDLLGQHDAAVIRLALMHYHHRIGGEWQSELLDEAERLYKHIKLCTRRATKLQAETLLADVRESLDDDLNTLEVIDALHRFVRVLDKTESEDPEAQALVAKTLDLLGLTKR